MVESDGCDSQVPGRRWGPGEGAVGIEVATAPIGRCCLGSRLFLSHSQRNQGLLPCTLPDLRPVGPAPAGSMVGVTWCDVAGKTPAKSNRRSLLQTWSRVSGQGHTGHPRHGVSGDSMAPRLQCWPQSEPLDSPQMPGVSLWWTLLLLCVFSLSKSTSPRLQTSGLGSPHPPANHRLLLLFAWFSPCHPTQRR